MLVAAAEAKSSAFKSGFPISGWNKFSLSLSLSLDKTMPVFSWSKIMLNRYLQVLVVVVAQMAKHSTKGSGFQSVWNPASFLQYFKEICLRNRHIFVNVSSLFQICSLQKNSTVILLIELECRRTVILIHLWRQSVQFNKKDIYLDYKKMTAKKVGHTMSPKPFIWAGDHLAKWPSKS